MRFKTYKHTQKANNRIKESAFVYKYVSVNDQRGWK